MCHYYKLATINLTQKINISFFIEIICFILISFLYLQSGFFIIVLDLRLTSGGGLSRRHSTIFIEETGVKTLRTF